jgi:hypothetical protein
MKAYSIKSGILQINGSIISGLASGDDVITFEPFTDAATPDFGADGFLEVSVSANQGGKVAIKTQQTSNVNAIFQQFYNDQVVSGDLFTPLFGSWRATNGASYTLAGGVMTKQAKIGFGEKASPREWEFVFETMIFDEGTTAALAG